MALKDLVSDLSNFKGQSQYDDLENQIKNGVDFFDNETAGATGFTPKTNLETKYNKFISNVKENNVLPNQYTNSPTVSAPNAGVRLNDKTRSAYGTFGEYSEAGNPGLSNPSHVLSADNILGLRIQPQFLSDFMDTPLANYNSKLSPPDDITQTFSLEPKFQSLPDFTQWGSFTTPWSMEFPQFQSPFMTTPLANYNSQYSPETTTETFVVPKEAWRISADSPVNDTYQPNFSPITLKSQYNNSDKIKDLFKFSGDTFKNVPNGLNIYMQFGTADFRTVANKGPFEGNNTHPIILRKPGSNWNNILNERGIVSEGGMIEGMLGTVGLLTRTNVALEDKARVGKFLFSEKGKNFLAKQLAFQALNPTLESKLYNPLSTLGIAGLNDLFTKNPKQAIKGLLRAAGSFLFPTHVERHVHTIGDGRYENIIIDTNNGNGRLSYQSEAFSSDYVPDLDLPELPKANTGIGFIDGFANKISAPINKKIQSVEDNFNEAEAATKIALSNPNRYLGFVSSAPVTISDGKPSFFATPLTTPVTDVKRATDKKGKTFNKETNIKSDGELIKRHSTLSYGQLKTANAYGVSVLVSPSEQNDIIRKTASEGEIVLSHRLDDRLKGKNINDRIGTYNKNITPSRNQVLGEVKTDSTDGSVGMDSSNVDRINMIPYGSDPKQSSDEFPAPPDTVNGDFIKFRFKDVVNNKWIIFRAILEGISDSIAPEYSEERYIGRPDKVYTYQGADRNISFGFSIYPKSKQELPILMEKLNYLIGLCYPTFTGKEEERMITPFIELTMGDMFVNTPGLLGSLTVTVEEASTWEIQEGLQFPHFIKAQCEFKHIGKYVPASTSKHYDLNWLKADGLSGNRYGGADLGFNEYPDRSKEYRDSLYKNLGQKIGT